MQQSIDENDNKIILKNLKFYTFYEVIESLNSIFENNQISHEEK